MHSIVKIRNVSEWAYDGVCLYVCLYVRIEVWQHFYIELWLDCDASLFIFLGHFCMIALCLLFLLLSKDVSNVICEKNHLQAAQLLYEEETF